MALFGLHKAEERRLSLERKVYLTTKNSEKYSEAVTDTTQNCHGSLVAAESEVIVIKSRRVTSL